MIRFRAPHARAFGLAAALLFAIEASPQSSPPASSQAVPGTQPAEQREGTRIVTVRVVTESGALVGENPPDLAVAPGRPLDAESVRESMRRLYRSGRYADLRAVTAEVPGGVRLDFIVRPNLFVNLVRVEGVPDPPGDGRALAALRLAPGEVFRASMMSEAIERLRSTMREDGYYEARLAPALAPHPETNQMDITVSVTPGPRAHAGAVALRNHTSFSNVELLQRAGLRPGSDLNSSKLQKASDKTRKYLTKKGYLGARATFRRGDYDPRSREVPLEFEVVAGPRVRVEVTGARISSSDLRKLLPIYEEGTVDEDLLQEGRRNLRDRMEREGYFDADVSYHVSAKTPQEGQPESPASEQLISYVITRGAKRKLVGVAFAGNHYFDSELLRTRIQMQPADYASPGRYSERLLASDTDSILDLYASNGFAGVKVNARTEQDYRGHKGDIFVHFEIEEGPQTLVSELHIEGNHALDDQTLEGVAGSVRCQPYSEFNVTADRDNILALYYNQGFPQAQFTPSTELQQSSGCPRATGPGVRLTYRITEGPQERVVNVLYGGYEHTKAGILRREVEIKPGEPLRQGDVVETQRRLYNLGIFSRVNIAPQNPEGDDENKTMLVLVEEAKRFTIGYGGGVEVQRVGSAADPVNGVFRASPRGIFEASWANISGRADTLSFKSRASLLQGRALLSYTSPNYFGRPNFSIQLTGFADKTRDINTFTSLRYEASAQLAERISPVTSLLYRYTFRRVSVGALRVSPEQIPLFNQPTLISGFGATWLRDARRPTPADPTEGTFNTADVSIYPSRLGSGASFVRYFFQNSTFHPLPHRLTFARTVRFGLLSPFGDTVSLVFPLPVGATVIPLPERFFAGGGNSLRGFGLNQAGPRDPDTGFPVGGQALLMFSQELRFPMKLPLVGTRLSGAMFYDAGNVFSRLGRITLRTSPTSFSRDTGDLAYFSHTVGIGVRYPTPIGPVRVDLALQLNPAVFRSLDASGAPQFARLPRFQFFFNFGSGF